MLICGGVEDEKDDSTSINAAEMYDAWSGLWEGSIRGTGSWRTLEEASVVRNYHSVALLMPDGAVWTAGSNKNKKQNEREMRIEIYRPWYFCSDRPLILYSPSGIRFREKFYLYTTQARSIRRVAVIRAGSVTHGFNSDQRYVGLKIAEVNGTKLSIHAPPDGTVAVPGYYLLFVINSQRIPSKGKFIHIEA
jgi:hypothetical protein